MLFRQWCHGRGDAVLCLRPSSTGRAKTQDLEVVKSGPWFSKYNDSRRLFHRLQLLLLRVLSSLQRTVVKETIFAVTMTKLWQSLDNVPAWAHEVTGEVSDKSAAPCVALTEPLLSGSEKHTVVQILVLIEDSWISGVPTQKKATIVGCRCVCLSVSPVPGTEKGSNALSQLSRGSRGQLWSDEVDHRRMSKDWRRMMVLWRYYY